MNWHILNQWEQWALGIGCSLAAALIVFALGRIRWNKRGIPRGAAKQIASPAMTQTFQPTINIYPPIADAGATPQATQKRSEVEPTSSLPNFEYKGSMEKRVFINPEASCGISDPHNSEEREKSLQGFVLRFENTPNGNTARALDLIAKVSFQCSTSAREQSFGYGVWLNSPCNATGMDVGDTRELVLICVIDGGLFSFDDRREGNHDFHSEWSWLDARPVDSLESVRIRLIDKITGAVGTFSFRIWYEGGHFNVGLA